LTFAQCFATERRIPAVPTTPLRFDEHKRSTQRETLMSAKTMDVCSLRDSVVDEYRKFATSFTTIHAEDIRAQIDAIYAEGRFWPDPLIQINPRYRHGTTLETLITGGALHPRTAEIFRDGDGPLSLYKHQEQAIALAAQGESFVVTTGTGSGKSLCFFIPIVSAVLTEKPKSSAPRTLSGGYRRLSCARSYRTRRHSQRRSPSVGPSRSLSRGGVPGCPIWWTRNRGRDVRASWQRRTQFLRRS
jgi:hypothetical protein